MTPVERVNGLLAAVASWSPARAEALREAFDALRAEREAAVAAEREACARLVDCMHESACTIADCPHAAMAARIRARGQR